MIYQTSQLLFTIALILQEHLNNFGNFLQGANSGANSRLWPKKGSGTFANSTPNNISTFFNFQGASGSALVAAGVKGKVGGIGYGEVSWATDNKLAVANIRNAAGEFIAPDAAGYLSIFRWRNY